MKKKKSGYAIVEQEIERLKDYSISALIEARSSEKTTVLYEEFLETKLHLYDSMLELLEEKLSLEVNNETTAQDNQ